MKFVARTILAAVLTFGMRKFLNGRTSKGYDQRN